MEVLELHGINGDTIWECESAQTCEWESVDMGMGECGHGNWNVDMGMGEKWENEIREICRKMK